jgi:hypothetical protein
MIREIEEREMCILFKKTKTPLMQKLLFNSFLFLFNSAILLLVKLFSI